MSAPHSSSLWNAYLEAIVELGREIPHLRLVAPTDRGGEGVGTFQRNFPERFSPADPSASACFREAGRLGSGEALVFVSTEASAVTEAYGAMRESVARPGANVKLIARFPWPSASSARADSYPVEEIGLMRGLPGMMVVVPCDAPTTRGAMRALAAVRGPAYVRLAEGTLPVLTDGTFALGRANVLREGKDLTVVSAGPLLGAALALAEEFHQVGVSVRVLDMASVKPIDAPALLRAARDTGALLVVEEHTVLTGLGEAVAATVAENFSVPVRRVGVPDLFEAPTAPHGALGPAGDRMRDEAWELLRLRGKVQ